MLPFSAKHHFVREYRLIDVFVQSGWHLLVAIQGNFEQMRLSTGTVPSHELSHSPALRTLVWAIVNGKQVPLRRPRLTDIACGFKYFYKTRNRDETDLYHLRLRTSKSCIDLTS